MMMFWAPPALAAAIGFGTGLLYFAGLWWTVAQLRRVRLPALWTLASFLMRAATALAVIGLTAQGRWQRILFCLAGFTLARVLLLRRLRPEAGGENGFRKAGRTQPDRQG